MSSNVMDTAKGGEQTQYESEHNDQIPSSKSTGQFGDSEDGTTTDPNQTDEVKQEKKERGEQKAENMRYGQTISEGGMSGFTSGQSGEATQGSYGQVADSSEDSSADAQREASGYGENEDQSREIGG